MDDLRSDLFRLIDKTPNLDWLLLTKRPENVARMWCSHVNLDGRPPSRLCRHNIWILASASDQASYDSQVAALVVNGLGRCLVLGMSLEPLVGPIDLRLEECVIPKGHAELAERLSWVIVGGESGPDARPCQVEWVRSIVKQCDEAAVPCFVKQLGAKAISSRPYERVSLGISHPKGGDPSEWPEDLRVQQYPVSW
jgi:protein gp37